ncbi:endogenous retrovirus group K member 5 Gag polyprotein-like protein, partial [Leptotrombidium deliense]
ANRQHMWRAISQFKPQPAAFPVYVDPQGAHYHHPLDWSLVKQLKEAVISYGPQASYTVSLIETLGQSAMTPDDWEHLCKATLSGGQFLIWKAAWHEFSQETARANLQAGNAAWNFFMLTGQGQYAGYQNQLNYNLAVYQQVAMAALKAWKLITPQGETQGQLSKIVQG